MVEEVNSMYERSLTPALVYREYISCLRNIYTEFCKSHFGAKNGEEMLAAVDDRLSKLKEL